MGKSLATYLAGGGGGQKDLEQGNHVLRQARQHGLGKTIILLEQVWQHGPSNTIMVLQQVWQHGLSNNHVLRQAWQHGLENNHKLEQRSGNTACITIILYFYNMY
jgi:hypothetical protein